MGMLNKKMWTSYCDNKGRAAVEYAMFLALIVFIYWAIRTVLDH